MKEKISITLSPSKVLAQIDPLARARLSRSAFLERTLRIYFRKRAARKANAYDLERINAAAGRLNAEAEDVLTYCAPDVEDLPC